MGALSEAIHENIKATSFVKEGSILNMSTNYVQTCDSHSEVDSQGLEHGDCIPGKEAGTT
jgi:hypothetical protein